MVKPKIECFDGHNDILSKIWENKSLSPDCFIAGFDEAEVDLPKAKQGGLAGGLCAIFPPSTDETPDKDGILPALSHRDALKSTMEMADILLKIEAQAPEKFKICKSAKEIRQAFEQKQFAAVFHIEGAEAISDSFEELSMLYERGLRSLGPVWSRPNIFAFGVPFRFPSSPDIGPGLTEAGKRLIKACNKLRIMIDLSHMNEKGFFDIAKISDAPLVASHSNAYRLSQQSRNLTDEQLRTIRDSNGLVGINFGVKFLRKDGQRNTDTPLETIVDHIRYMVDLIGIDHVGFGSDFDGTTIPSDLENCSSMPKLIEAMEKAGFHKDEITKIAARNWVSVLERIWGE